MGRQDNNFPIDYLSGLQGRTYGADQLRPLDYNWQIYNYSPSGRDEYQNRYTWNPMQAGGRHAGGSEEGLHPSNWGEILALNEPLLRERGYQGALTGEEALPWLQANNIVVGQTGPQKDGIARHGNYYSQLFDAGNNYSPLGQGYRTVNDYAEEGVNLAKVALAAVGGAVAAPASGAAAGTTGAGTAGAFYTAPTWQQAGWSALSNGAMAEANGGDFLKGAAGGLLSSGLSGLNVGAGLGLDGVQGGIVNGAARGLISSGLTGGDMGNGALSGGVTGGLAAWNPAQQIGITNPALASNVNRAISTLAGQAANGQSVDLGGVAARSAINYGGGLLSGALRDGASSFLNDGGAQQSSGADMSGNFFGGDQFGGPVTGAGGSFADLWASPGWQDSENYFSNQPAGFDMGMFNFSGGTDGSAQGGSFWDTLANGAGKWVSDPNNSMKLIGAVGGAVDQKDRQETQTRDPWGPAQPFILANLQRGQELQNQLQQNPFTGQQQAAYNNIGGLLNAINQNAGGLLGGYQANATGANNYDRANPRKALTGSAPVQANWMPSLLNFFPKQGG